ncbi:hypothetical protein SAMN03159496_02505 [Rhizobium sp. NFR07]|nr:hypothetical protein SAMN03159496_02505 [Rhizobium sp. NFR07]
MMSDLQRPTQSGHSRLCTPLCPAGHLPHKGGDRPGGRSPVLINLLISIDAATKAMVVPLVISPPVGEMPGRAEGGWLAPAFAGSLPALTASNKETHHVPRS